LKKLDLNPSGTVVTVLIWTLPVITPLFMGLQILAPLPVFFYLIESGRTRGINTIAIALLVSALVMFLAGQLGGLVFTLSMIAMGASLALEAKKNQGNPVGAGFKAGLVLLLGWLLWSFFYGMTQPGSSTLYQDILNSLDTGLVEVGKSLKENAEMSPEQGLEVEATIARLREFMPRVMPGLLLVTMLNTVFLNMVAGKWLLRRKEPTLAPWPPVAEWRLPESLVLLVILAGFCLLLPVALIKTIGLNLLLVCGAIYFFQGLAILTSFLIRWSVPPPLRALIFILVLIQAYGVALLAVIGLIDVWTDLRRPRPKIEVEDK
jgi:uncharacterized protein YybS (DUF2232 family)